MNNYLSRFKGTIIAFVVFISMLGALLFFDTEKPVDVETEKVFEGLEPEEIVSVKIVNRESEILLKREESDWLLETASGKYSADSEIVQNLIEDITTMEAEKKMSGENADLDEYGFVNSETEFAVTTIDTEYPVIVGDKSPVGSGTYLYELGDGDILIVKDNYLQALLDKQPSDFRKRKLVNLPYAEVNRIDIRVGDFSIELKKEGGKWLGIGISEPVEVDQKKVNQVIREYSQLDAGGFENDDPEGLESYGLDDPRAEIALYIEEEPSVILFGKRKDENDYYIKVSSDKSVYTVSKNYFKDLPKNIDQITKQ